MVRMSETVNINCLCKQLTSTVVRLYVPWQIYLRAVYFLSLCISVCAQCITDQMCYVSMMSFWIELGNMMIWYWYWTAWYTFMSIAFIVRYLKKKKKLSINVSFLFIIKYFNFYNFWTKNKSLKLYWSFVSTLLAKPYQIISTYFGSHAVLFAVKWLPSVYNGRLHVPLLSATLWWVMYIFPWKQWTI